MPPSCFASHAVQGLEEDGLKTALLSQLKQHHEYLDKKMRI